MFADTLRGFVADELDQPLVNRFEQIAARRGDLLAIHDESGDWTYAQVNTAANRIAASLLSRLDSAGQPVVLLFESSAWLIVAIVAVLKSGNFYIPVDPQQPAKRTKSLFAEAEAVVLLCDAHLSSLAREIASPEKVLWVSCTSPGTGGPDLRVTTAPDDPAYVLYTSGSTGEPKGVVQTQRNVLFDIRRLTNDFRVTSDDRFALLFYPWFSASIGPVFGALLNGASVHLYSIARKGISPLADWLRRQEVSICDINLAAFRQLTGSPASVPAFPAMRVVGLGGEPVTRHDFDRFRQHFAPGTILQNGYGATETRTISQFLLTHDSQFQGNIVPVGRPVPGKTVLLQREDGTEVDLGEPGEIVVRSRYLSPGYWRRPDLTRNAFTGHTSEERVYRTGDTGLWLQNGSLLHSGRLDRQVKIRGHRVEPAEVESVLLQLPECREAIVVPHHNKEGEASLAAWIVPSAERPGVSAIRTSLAGELPGYMIPQRILFLESLPRLANGKVDLRSLPAATESRPELDTVFVAPRDHLEREIAKTARELLRCEDIGADDDLFDLGFDSLKTLEFLTAVRIRLDRDVPIALFLRKPSIAGIAKTIREGTPAAASKCLIPVQTEGSRPPLFCFHCRDGEAGRWFELARLLGPDQPVYAFQARGLDGVHPPHESVAAMADCYAREILQVCPEQPAWLFGYSLGGLIAHECGRQLAQRGRSPGPLILVDALDLGTHGRIWQAARKLNRALHRWIRETPVTRQPAESAPSSTPPKPANTAVDEAIRHAVTVHRPLPFSGSAIYFAPSVSGSSFPQTGDRPWRKLVLGEVEVRITPGEHANMLKQPNLTEFAKQLKQILGCDTQERSHQQPGRAACFSVSVAPQP